MNNSIEGSGFYVVSSFSEQKKHYFSGTIFNDKSIVIGERGLEIYLKNNEFPDLSGPLDGRFSIIKVTKEIVLARTDIFGQDILYYYIKNNVWAISNSFILLCRHLTDNGERLKIDKDQIDVLKVRHGITQQLVSNDTLIHNIKVLPRNKILKVTKKNKGFNFIDISPILQSQSYIENLDKFFKRTIDINHTLINYFESRVTVDITGGVDSRVVLATILASDVDLSKINFMCSKSVGNDYEVALKLANRYGFNITNKSYIFGQGSQDNLYDLWKLGSLGVYFPIYFPSSSRPQSLLHYHGACGECFRDFYLQPANEYMSHVALGQSNQSALYALNRKIGKALYEIDAPANTKVSMIDYYWNYRSRFHVGRNTHRNLSEYYVTPMASIYLAKAFEQLNELEKEKGSLVLDLFVRCYPDVLNISFDEKEKNYSEIDISKSLKRVASSNEDTDNSRPSKLKVFYELEPRQQRTEKKSSMIDLLILDLEKYSRIVTEFNFFTTEEVQLAMDNVKKSPWNARLGIDASKIISVGELLSLKNIGL
ncbi:hypothetical protein [Psychrobacter sp. TWP2-1-2]|uniref:hypothetical protein n=1 Tax=Psychrobacter sp. TWP2-1-2 TaxID=2804623 RepID=UPI003CF0BCDC